MNEELYEMSRDIEEDYDSHYLGLKREQGNKHPLLNPDSPHYSMVDGVATIERMEQMYSVEELIAWACITAMNYRMRIGHKDDVTKEVNKILGYEAYYKYLSEKQHD